MKRRVLWILWALVPVALIALHLSAGPRLMAHDRAGRAIQAGLVALDSAAWDDAAGAFGTAKESLTKQEHAEVTKIASTYTKLEGSQANAMIRLLEILEDLDDTQNVYSNFDFDEAAVASASH